MKLGTFMAIAAVIAFVFGAGLYPGTRADDGNVWRNAG
jgi:hypothetical protein